MQRVLVILTVIVVVTVSLGVGALAANWPFWRRAWQWHVAAESWPAALDGPVQVIHGGAATRALAFEPLPQIARIAQQADTRALLRAVEGGAAHGWFAAGIDAATPVDGRDLSAALLVPLFAMLAEQRPGMLDAPIGTWLRDWREDRRGLISARQLFQQLSGLPERAFAPLNPFSVPAQLASGPDFDRAAQHWRMEWPAGSHFEPSPVNAQLLAVVATAAGGAPVAAQLQRLWSGFAADDAVLLLDHPRGNPAAHCCIRAAAADWLRLGLVLAADGQTATGRLWQPGFVARELAAAAPVHAGHGLGFELLPLPDGEIVFATGAAGRRLLVAPARRAALLWVGEGAAPADLPLLLPEADKTPLGQGSRE